MRRMLAFLATGFDWDDGNLAKCRKHGLAMDDIEAVFKGALQVATDDKHSAAETRYYAIGRGVGIRSGRNRRRYSISTSECFCSS